MDTKLIDRYIEMNHKKKALEEELEDHKKEMSQVENFILELMLEEGIQNLRTDKGMAYVNKTFAATLKNDVEPLEAIHEVFEEHGLGHMVKTSINANTLRAYVKEKIESEEGLPEEIEKRIKITEVQHLRVRRK